TERIETHRIVEYHGALVGSHRKARLHFEDPCSVRRCGAVDYLLARVDLEFAQGLVSQPARAHLGEGGSKRLQYLVGGLLPGPSFGLAPTLHDRCVREDRRQQSHSTWGRIQHRALRAGEFVGWDTSPRHPIATWTHNAQRGHSRLLRQSLR